MATVTRRSVVATGAKLAYVAPVVAASMRLGMSGAAAISAPAASVPTCPAGYASVTFGPADLADLTPQAPDAAKVTAGARVGISGNSWFDHRDGRYDMLAFRYEARLLPDLVRLDVHVAFVGDGAAVKRYDLPWETADTGEGFLTAPGESAIRAITLCHRSNR